MKFKKNDIVRCEKHDRLMIVDKYHNFTDSLISGTGTGNRVVVTEGGNYKEEDLIHVTVTGNIKKAITEAMKFINQHPDNCWWQNVMINSLIMEGVAIGWIRRISVTQVEWTEKAVKELF